MGDNLYYEESTADIVGFSYTRTKYRFTKFEEVNDYDIEYISEEKTYEDPSGIFIMVKCGDCNGIYMDYRYSGKDIFNLDHWKCPCCGKKVRVYTVYDELDRQNKVFNDWLFDVDYQT